MPHTMQPDQETVKGIEQLLNGMVVNLAALPLTPQQKADILRGSAAEMLNASGINMHGEALQTPLAASPLETKQLAGMTGKDATAFRSEYFISPYKQMPAGSRGLVSYTDKASRERMVLLVRPRNSKDEWVMPGGYMDQMPNGSAMPSRTQMGDRDRLEEATAGNDIGSALPQFVQSGTDPVAPIKTVDLEQATSALKTVLKTALKEQGWTGADRVQKDGDFARTALSATKIELPLSPNTGKPYDFTPNDTFVREVEEETGLQLAGQSGKLHVLDTMASYAYSGSYHENYSATTLFAADLGERSEAPKLQPQDSEIAEAAWIPASAIRKTPGTGAYLIHDKGHEGHHLCSNQVASAEHAMNTLLNERIREVSGQSYANAQSVKAALGSWVGRSALEGQEAAQKVALSVAKIPFTEKGEMVPSLFGKEGQQHSKSLELLAMLLAKEPQKQQQQPVELTQRALDRRNNNSENPFIAL